MCPSDGKLNLKITNETGLHDSIFMLTRNALWNPNFHGEYLIFTSYPTILKKGEAKIVNLNVPTEESVYIYWDLLNIDKAPKNAMQVDSFYLQKGDSVSFEIKY
jgi:hypothetical protein